MNPFIIQVGKVLIQTTAKQLPKFLTRFKGAKQIKNPTSAQVDKARKITGNLENFSKADKRILKKADTARPTIIQSLTGTGRTGAQETIKKGLRGTGESRRSFAKGAGAATGVIATVGAGGKLIYDAATKGGSTTAKSDVKSKKKKSSIPTEKPTPRPKKKMFMKERSGKDSDVEFGTGKAKTKLSTGGATGLKKISDDQPGLKALKKKAPQVVRNMGYLRKGSLVTKKKTKGGSKGGKGILVVSIGVGKMTKKKPTTKKKTTKKTKRG